jgi:hypothetical protein
VSGIRFGISSEKPLLEILIKLFAIEETKSFFPQKMAMAPFCTNLRPRYKAIECPFSI